MKKCTRTAICGAAIATTLGLAAGAARADWTGKGEAGLVIANGNTDSKTISAKLGLVDTFGDWKLDYNLAAIKASTSGVETIERYTAGQQTNYKLDVHSFIFGAFDYQDDKFSGFLYQADAMGGYGYQFYDSKKIKLSLQVGAGYRKSKDDLGDQSKGKAVETVGMNYENAITDTTKVLDKFTVVSGTDNTQMHNFLGLDVKISTKLALDIGLDVQRNSHPPAPKKTTDELETVAVVYAF